jgi:hypothetical protein
VRQFSVFRPRFSDAPEGIGGMKTGIRDTPRMGWSRVMEPLERFQPTYAVHREDACTRKKAIEAAKTRDFVRGGNAASSILAGAGKHDSQGTVSAWKE